MKSRKRSKTSFVVVVFNINLRTFTHLQRLHSLTHQTHRCRVPSLRVHPIRNFAQRLLHILAYDDVAPVAIRNFHVLQLRRAHDCPAQIRPGEIRAGEIRLPEICVGQIRIHKRRPGEIGAEKRDTRQVGAVKVGAFERPLGEERPGAGEFFPRVIVPIARVRRALGGLRNGDRGGRTEGQRGGERERNQEF